MDVHCIDMYLAENAKYLLYSSLVIVLDGVSQPCLMPLFPTEIFLSYCSLKETLILGDFHGH